VGVYLLAIIDSFYDPATGLYHPAWLFRHSLAMEGLLRSGVTVPRAAYDALLAAQLPDGAWFWSKDGTQGDVDTTGRVLYLLAGLAKVPGNSPYEKAADWLGDMRLPEGGWNTGFETDPPAPPNGNSTALAIAGLMATGQDPAAALVDGDGKSLLETLLAFQEPSGAFVFIKQPGLEEGRLVATTEALSVLALLLEEQTACALPYLPMILAL